MTSNMIYIVALGVGFKCPRKINLNTQWGGAISNRLSVSLSVLFSELPNSGGPLSPRHPPSNVVPEIKV